MMNEVVTGVPIRSYTRTLRARWAWIAVTALIAAALAALYLVLSPRDYTATAVVNVEVFSTSASSDRPASSIIDMRTETELAGSYATAVLAAEEMGETWEPRAVLQGTSVSAGSNGTIMRVQFTDEDADRAREAANGVALAYLETRQDQALQGAEASTEAIDTRLDELNDQLSVTMGEIAASEVGSTERDNAEADAARLRSEIDSLVTSRTSYFGLSGTPGQLITPAEAASVSVVPQVSIVLAGSLLGGLALGVVLAFARERFARNVDSRIASESLVTLPVWSADPGGENKGEAVWNTTAQLFSHAVRGRSRVCVVALGEQPCAAQLARLLVDRAEQIPEGPAAQFVHQGEDHADILAEVRGNGAVVLVVPTSYRKRSLLRLLDLLDQVAIEVLGIAVTPLRAPVVTGMSAPRQRPPLRNAPQSHEERPDTEDEPARDGSVVRPSALDGPRAQLEPEVARCG